MDQEVIGGYKILKPMGAGGMAKVYLAVHKDVPNLKVILKILSDSRLVERFKQEADKLALLDGNPNICRIKHFFHHGDNIVIAMEYIDGITLEDRINRKGKLDTRETVKITRDVLGVIQFAHQKGIFHRDIKPSNIMIDKQGTVKVIDFGIAKAESDPNLTLAGSSCGTPAYMAPEQFTPSDNTNYALVDVYAVGVTMYAMLTGELPFKGDNEFAIRDAKLFTDPPRPRELNSDIDKRLDEVIMRCMAKDPADRFASVDELLAALKPYTEIESTEPVEPVRARQQKRKNKIPVKLVGGVIATVVVAAVLFFYPRGSDSGPETPTLAGPPDGSQIESPLPVLSWIRTAGPDETYTLEYANNSDFFISELVTDLTANSYAVKDSLENDIYFWRVQTVGSAGDSSGYGEPFTFTIETTISEVVQGSVSITVRPNADIYVDGDLIESSSSGLLATLDTGLHTVTARNNRATRKEQSRDVNILPDTTISLAFTFRFPAPKEAAPVEPPVESVTTGSVVIGSKPVNGAIVFINGRRQERATPNTFELDPGRHIIRATLELNGTSVERTDTIQVSAGKSAKLVLDFEN